MSNNNISDKANPESNRNLEELKAIESLFLEFDFFQRVGGGIGITRMIPALEKINKI